MRPPFIVSELWVSRPVVVSPFWVPPPVGLLPFWMPAPFGVAKWGFFADLGCASVNARATGRNKRRVTSPAVSKAVARSFGSIVKRYQAPFGPPAWSSDLMKEAHALREFMSGMYWL